ncbi:MAG: hypothetical protein IJS28_02065 [Synergistaceae bacterium]|nr:hypothetical protein [Synergistaceae bacterium]
MRRFFLLMLLAVIMSVSFYAHPSYSEDNYLQPVSADLQKEHLNGNNDSAYVREIPGAGISRNKVTPSDSYYDMRQDPNRGGGNFVTGVKNQNSYNTSWAFAAMGAIESNYLIQSGKTLDLSEMYLAYFSLLNPDKSKAFANVSSFSDAMNHGGNAFYAAALFSRLDGPVLESDFPYSQTAPSKSSPESYKRVLRVRDALSLRVATTTDENLLYGFTVNAGDSSRTSAKARILQFGGIVAAYYDDDNDYKKTASNGTSFYSTTRNYNPDGSPNTSKTPNRDVLLVGWDDNYSRTNFKTQPPMDGAWLAKNSRGTSWGDNGYFWISYNNYLRDGTSFVVEEVSPDMKAYYYDALGACSAWGWQTLPLYAANVFKAERGR